MTIKPLPFKVAAFIQFQVVPHQPEKNLQKVALLLEAYNPKPGTLMVLPEMWAAGFENSKKQKFAPRTPGILASMQDLAGRYDILLGGSLAELANGDQKPKNTLYLVGKEGVIGSIAKQYMFSHWKEDYFYQPGKNSQPIEVAGCRIGGMVCYDLRFPEVAREQSFKGAQLIMVSAQWPLTRRDHWLALLQARAIENQVFIVGVNGCGLVGGMELGGSSVIIDPTGAVLAQAENDEVVGGVELDIRSQKTVRSLFCPPGERPWRHDDDNKIISRQSISNEISFIRQQGAEIAFTNGCFDILHAGHVSYLEKARETADCLVVGLNSDASIHRLKGRGRPVNSELERARVLAGLGCVDFIVLFEEDTPHDLITTILPDVLVKGADWQEEEIVGAKEVKEAGGRVARILFEYDNSTTALIGKIQQTAIK